MNSKHVLPSSHVSNVLQLCIGFVL